MSIQLTHVKTNLESIVDGPRDGRSNPEDEFMNALPELSDSSMEIPLSSFRKESIITTSDVDNARAVHRNRAPRLAAAAIASERKQAEADVKSEPMEIVTPGAKLVPELSVGKTQRVETAAAGQWTEIKVVDVEPEKPSKEVSGNNVSAKDGGDYIESPMDGFLINDHGRRERAWRNLAQRWYDKQPSFMDRGKQRWHARVEYDHQTDTVTWNKKSLPNSRLWKSTFDHSKPKTRLGQVMLVLMEKNESKIIERMLESIVESIDTFCILDTGSSDGTEQIMWDFLVTKHKKQGAIYKTDWYDFGTNRTITVQLANRCQSDWFLLMDADYRLVQTNPAIPWKSQLPPLATAPAWLLLKTTGDLDYARPHLVRGDVLWCYICRTHEYLSRSDHDKSTVNFHQQNFDALKIDHVGDGQSKADKMGRDVVLLLCDLLDNPKSERAFFYLSNTLRSIKMNDWALRSYKKAMNNCGWNEEQMCSSKGSLECMFAMPNVSFERMLVMALHGMTQNPERLEIPSLFLRKIRTTKEWWPKYSHLTSSLAAFFTHNVYPGHQKLFIERPEHDFGFWQETSICSFYNPIYFELGLHMSHRIPTLPAFKEQGAAVQQQNLRNKALYDQKLDEWRKRGVRVTTPIRKHLLEQGHRALAQGKIAKAQSWYQHVLHTIVLEDHVPENLLPPPEKTAEERKIVGDQCDNFATPMFHKFHRLTAWQNAKCLTAMCTEIDQDRALACFQMGQCQQRLNNDNSNHIISAMYYIDAIKWLPGYPPAIAALYELTILKSSDVTRAILYLIRLTSMSQMANASVPLLRNIKANMDSLVLDQSEWLHVVMTQHLQGTSWLIPIEPKSNLPVTIANSTLAAPLWANHISTSLLVC